MSIEVSKRDFYHRWDEENIRKMFSFMDRRFSPIRKEQFIIKKKCKYDKLADMSVGLMIYDLDNIIMDIRKLLKNSKTTQLKRYGVQWNGFISELEEFRDD